MFYGKCSNTFESHRVSIDKAPVLSKTLNGIRVFESSIERIHANGGNSIMPLVRIFTSFRVQFVGYIAAVIRSLGSFLHPINIQKPHKLTILSG